MSWDDAFFAKLGPDYDRLFAEEVSATEAQVDFVVRMLQVPPGRRLLDVCCGTGRHALSLARRGYAVTAVDRSAAMLQVAQGKAAQLGLRAQWIQADARLLPPLPPFAGAICLFNSWGYFEDGREDGRVLVTIARKLHPGARLVLDVPNQSWLVDHPKGVHHAVALGAAVRERREYWEDTGRLEVSWTVLRAGTPPWQAVFRSSVYTLPQIEELLAKAGMVLEMAFGGFGGEALTSQSPRCILIARRPILLV